MSPIIAFFILAAIVVGICFLFDKGFTAIFRSKPQHISGLSVRVSKRYAGFGLVFATLGIASIMSGIGTSGVLFFGGIAVFAMGAGLVIYYMTFGIFYDEKSFLLTTFGHATQEYEYGSIVSQQLYLTSGHVVIELQLDNGKIISLQSTMDGVYHFMDTAFAGWCVAKGKYVEDCPFYDPSNSCWFPTSEDL